MKSIGSVKEDPVLEKRVSITPETVKKFTSINISVLIEKKYAEHLGMSDEEYKNNGAVIYNSAKEVFEKAEIILRVNCPKSSEINLIKDSSILIGQFDPLLDKEIINKLIKKKISIFSLNLLPRITRAQSMDVLSSQANLAGYRAVIESVEEFEKAIPMMMTAAGTVTPAKVLVIGAGVAGLQAIATAKRLGGIVSATDVRVVAKEQVESLGGKFLSVEGEENLEVSESREPLVDIIEGKNAVTVVIELPGVEKSDIKVEIKESIIFVTTINSKNYYKEIPLTGKIIANSARARYNNGILEIIINKDNKSDSENNIVVIE